MVQRCCQFSLSGLMEEVTKKSPANGAFFGNGASVSGSETVSDFIPTWTDF
jgi:hypothetical protein